MASRSIRAGIAEKDSDDGLHSSGKRDESIDKSALQLQDADCSAPDKVVDKERVSFGAVSGSGELVPKKSINFAWEDIFKTAENGGVEGWIRNAFEYHRANGFMTETAEEMNGDIGGFSNGFSMKRDDLTDKEMCQRIFFDVLVSGEFMAICKLFSENFCGIGVEKLFNLSVIDGRIQQETYKRMPMLFSSDILHLWKTLEFAGTRMVSIAKSLSDLSDTYCKQDFASRFCNHDKAHQPNACSEVRLPHSQCVVCEILNAPKVVIDRKEADDTTTDEAMLSDLEESSYCSSEDEREKLAKICKICRIEIGSDEKHLACGHMFCDRKYYHERCLTVEQRKSHSSCWYCPSCLCRVCASDTDDEKIVLCDGCDHGYHIHCLNPPLDAIPRGKWFCKKCAEGLQEIARVKSAYKSQGKNRSTEAKECKQASGKTSRKKQRRSIVESLSVADAMDMLSRAANSPSIENKSATPLSQSSSIEI